MPALPTSPGSSPTRLHEAIEKPGSITSSEELAVPQVAARPDHDTADAKHNDLELGLSPPGGDHLPPNGHSLQATWCRCLQAIKRFILDQYFLLGFGLIVIIASQIQVPQSQQSTKETITVYITISLIFFVTGCTLPTMGLVQNYSNWKAHIFVQVQSYLMTSTIVYGVVSLAATNIHLFDPGLLIGLVFMGCCPTTISSNIVMTRRAHGNDALTVVQSTIGNFLGPFLSPILLQMYVAGGAWYTNVLPPVSAGGGYGQLYRRVFKQLGLSMFLPLAVGQVIQYLFPKTIRKVMVDWKLAKINTVAMLVILWQTYDGAFAQHAFTRGVPGSNMVFVVFISIAFYILWTAVCVGLSLLWLDRKDTVAIAYCVPAKSVAIGVPLASVLYPGLSSLTKAKFQVPLVIFQGLQIAAGSLLTPVFRKWADAAKKGSDQHSQEAGPDVGSAPASERPT